MKEPDAESLELMSESDAESRHGLVLHDPEEDELEHLAMDEDLFGFAVTSLIRDSEMLDPNKRSNKGLRKVRLVMSQALLFVNIALQIYVLIAIKAYVTSKAVHDIREVYSKYELEMYETGHTFHTPNGFLRGVDGPTGPYFHPERFQQQGVFSDEEKSLVCRIAFSQPYYYMIILGIWTLTVIGDIKRVIELFMALIVNMDRTPAMYEYDAIGRRGSLCPTVDNVKVHVSPAILKKAHCNDNFEQYAKQCVVEKLEDLEGNDRLVVGLSMPVKFYICIGVLLPRFLISSALLWLGCRWLTATTSFTDILLNAVALEFILCLKDLIYTTVVPAKNKRDVQHTFLLPKLGKQANGEYTYMMKGHYWTYFSSFGWLFATLGWVLFYVYWFQMVLPDYQWDVHDVCASYLESFYSLTVTVAPGAQQ